MGLPCNGKHEYSVGDECWCVKGYERIGEEGDPCVPECELWEIRDLDDNTCVISSACETYGKKLLREGPAETSWLPWLLLVIGVLNLMGIIVLLIRSQRSPPVIPAEVEEEVRLKPKPTPKKREWPAPRPK